MFRSLSLVFALCFLALCLAQTDDGRCAYCENFQCGPNGIGGSCGTCPVGQSCYRGQCICDRNCDGRECGADGCGTLCGECLAGQVCQDGICVGTCTPQCVRPNGSLRTCGWDRCGRNDRCGTCPEGCNFKCRDGTCECVPLCDGKHCGPDGCGGSCGTCEGDAICQGENDPFPGQCYFDCFLSMTVEVKERPTDSLVNGACSVDITGPLGFSAQDQTYPGPNPGFFEVEITDSKFGDYSFTATCPGYQVAFQTTTVTRNGQRVTIYVDWNLIQVEVRDERDQSLIPTASIAISAAGGYSLQVAYVSPRYTWSHNGFKSYTFVTSATGYSTRTVSETVTVNTTLITLYLGVLGIPLNVVDCVNREPVSPATITVAGQTINYTGSTYSWPPPNGFVPYTFTTSATGYVSNTQTVSVTSTTTNITLCVNFPPIPVVITDCVTTEVITGQPVSVAASSSTYSSYSFSFSWTSSATTWTSVGFGSYSFSTTESTTYNATVHTQQVNASTTEIRFCLPPKPRCGDGVCNGAENSLSCADCGQIRGVISLAVGQKDQLGNITISVWPSPTNPALYMRRGETLPAPSFKITSDSKGYFGITKLSFDAPRNATQSGQYKRRFYFSLTGVFVDRTGDNDSQLPLLPLWWNYELTNKLYAGGSYVGTNGCPNLYFYMTPEFAYTDALVRIILSWGVQISTPSTSIPDLDMVIAGPVDPTAMSNFGSGVVNFDNKDEHSAIVGLPYAKLISDSAQGYGPEVFDFYGTGSGEEIGFSSTYAANAAANAYEVWVDKPNSSPNQDAIGSRIADTNAFIVVYQSRADGTNEQILFDQRTGVEYAYGFHNTDQWNAIPNDATMWHIIDLSQAEGGIKFQGFPGEQGQGRNEEPGCKYSYASSGYQSTKVFPCGHVAARGANPEYCPFTLTYPQTKK